MADFKLPGDKSFDFIVFFSDPTTEHLYWMNEQEDEWLTSCKTE